jgi:hypothetical protein
MKILAPASIPKVMVQMDKDTSRLGFSTADQLRKAGYVVKLHLGGKGPSDVSWKVEVRNKAPQVVLTDIAGKKKHEFTKPEDMLRFMKR